jgi:hypothetical protein
LPANVSVEVDGVSAAASEGSVSIKGSLGSKHRVRLSSGGREKVADVFIGEDGPSPLMVDLGPAPAAAAPAAPAKVSTPRPAPPPPAAPKANPLEMQMQ